ncbi:MAG: hypothetical protein NTW19_12470, partial [Planctomycetota bacterium]|nr:hypothetical protein [Planctomycetota bacterium]
MAVGRSDSGMGSGMGQGRRDRRGVGFACASAVLRLAVVALAVFALLACPRPVLAEESETPAAEPAVAATASTTSESPASAPSAAAAGALAELENIAKIAPARQVGQPGNDAVDALVHERFTKAVERHADAGRLAAAQELLAEAKKADDDLTAVRNGQSKGSSEAKAIASPWYIRVTIDEPASLMAILVLIAAANFTAGHLQKRKAAWIVGAVFLAAAPILWVVSTQVETPAKKYAREKKVSTTAQALEKELFDASMVALEADRKAAKALAGQWQSGRVWHDSAAFIPGKAELAVAGGSPVRLHQMAPNLVDPANVPEAGIEGPLVYAGAATPAELAGRHFENSVVLVEFASSTRWLDAVQLGARAVLVLDPPAGADATFTEAAQKTVSAPLSIPRFMVRRAELAKALGDDWETAVKATPAVKLTQGEPGRWQRKRVASDWIFIPGTVAPAEGKADIDQDTGRQVVVILAAKDTASIVPELSPGVTGAGNLALMLKMLEGFEQKQPRRPVLLAAVNDHANALAGEQELCWSLFAEPAAAGAELAWIESELAEQRFLAEAYGQPPTVESIEAMRTAESTVGGRLVRQKETAVDRLTQTRNLRRDERNRLQFRIEEDDRRARKGQPTRMTLAAKAEAQERLTYLQHEAEELTKLLRLFNRFGETTRLDQLPPDGVERTVKLFADVAADSLAATANLEETRRKLLDNIAVRRLLGSLATPPAKAPLKAAEVFAIRYPRVPVSLGLALNLSFGASTAGFFHLDSTRGDTGDTEFLPTTETQFQRVSKCTIDAAEAYAQSSGAPNLLVNTIRGVGGIPWAAYLGGRFAFPGRVMLQFSIPELTLATVRDARPRDYTPDDDLDSLNRGNFTALASFVLGYIPSLVDAPDIGASGAALNTPQPLSSQISVRQQDQFSITVPKTVRGGAVVAVQPAGVGSKLPNNADLFGDVRPVGVIMANDRGVVWLRGSSWRGASLHAFGYDKDFRRVQAASDLT